MKVSVKISVSIKITFTKTCINNLKNMQKSNLLKQDI